MYKKKNEYVEYVNKIIYGIWKYKIKCINDINIKMKINVYNIKGKYEESKVRKLIKYIKY